ncbi:hypothetical protein ACOMHN_026610 [Nucella lapillus]
MEQPRFGGAALLPLSTSDGEGTIPKFATNAMDSTKPSTLDLHHHQATHSAAGEADSGVQKVMEVLRQLGISPRLERYKLKDERQRETDSESVDSGVYCKNLLLKDKKGQAFLVLCGEDDTADLQVVKYHLNAQGNLHFASKNSMWSLLQVQPGAVSPFALIHSSDVRVFIDASLVKRIDQDSTKLFFHPLRADLKVGLMLSQLKMFLHHCNATLETLPSLVSYSAKRHYNNNAGGCHYKHRLNPEHHLASEFKESEMAGRLVSSLEQETERGEVEQPDDTFQQHTGLFQQLGIRVEVVPALGKMGASNYITLSCRSLYLKDKRNNYFLFICHENQKIDFSTLKAQLKPRKKIEPLSREELWSLLHLSENQEHPFALAQLKQPGFLVAISDNLYYEGKAVLTFPHPTNFSLRLEVTLKDLETLIRSTSHDLRTVQVKGNIEELQAISIVPPHSLKPVPFNDITHHSEGEGNCMHSAHRVYEGNCQLSLPDHEIVPAFSPQRRDNNLFYRLTAPLREWVLRCIRNLVQLLNHYLLNQISTVLRQTSGWRTLTQHSSTTGYCIKQTEEDQTNETEGQAKEWTNEDNDKAARIAKLQQVIEQSGIKVDLTEINQQERFLKGGPEMCKTLLLENGIGQFSVVLCREEDQPTRRNLRRLRSVFRSCSALHVASGRAMSNPLSWPEDNSMSWTPEDFNPMALMDMNLRSLGRVRVGITGALYSFPDTTLSFDLPPLGVTLSMSCDDLEEMIKLLGFYVVYIP